MHSVFDYIKRHKVLLWLIIPAFFLHMLVIMPSGSNICLSGHCGYHFWSANDNDGLWHVEIAAVAFKQIPFIIPTYAGGLLTGYNILLDFILFLFSVVGIPPIVTYFKIIPPIWFFLYTAILITFARKLKDSVLFVGTVLFFVYFGGHFGYLLTLYHDKMLVGGTQSFAIQSATSLLNLQFALSLPVLLYMLSLIKEKKWTLKETLLLTVLASVNLALKFYAGGISIFILGLYILESLYHKRSFSFFLKQVGICLAIISVTIILVYNPFGQTATQAEPILSLAPFATVHSVIEANDMVYMKDQVLQRYFLYSLGQFSLRLAWIETYSTVLYIFFNFGTRFFGLIYVLIQLFRKKLTRIDVYIFLSIIFSSTLTVLLVQRGDWWNTVQFMYYGIFLSNIFIAYFVYQLLKTKRLPWVISAAVIIALSLPTNLGIVRTFTSTDIGYIPQQEIEAMEVLKKLPDGVVFNSFEKNLNLHYPFYDYKGTGYVAAFTGKQLYFSHENVLFPLGVAYEPRKKRILDRDCEIFKEVDYIYFVKKHKTAYLTFCKSTVNKIFKVEFENSLVKLYSLKKMR